MNVSLQHPWLIADERLALGDQLLAILAGVTAVGDLDEVARTWDALPEVLHPAGIELVLQTHLFAGYPRTINALGRIRSLGCKLNTSSDAVPAQWRPDGEQLCSKIYGPSYERLRERVQSLHVDLDRWMLEVGYGRVLSRPGATARQRELGVLAVLGGQDVAPQLTSHLRGAFHVGATVDECAVVMELLGAIWGEAAREKAYAVFQAFQARMAAN
ncbi:MAG: carboxymuconolactone decarboxylase family protein [Myxococcota bacterium]|nr:carboxymuconolactone decarboxylase family protein [Myxococcota bacterium]